MEPPPDGWQDHGACTDRDLVDLFVPPSNLPAIERERRRRDAEAICATCPVQEECLTYALVYEESGTWGGTSERQRRRMRKALNVRPRRRPSFAGTLRGVAAAQAAGDPVTV